MTNPTLKRKMLSLHITYSLVLVIYISIGIVVYAHFSSSTSNLLLNQNAFKIQSYISWIPMRLLTIFSITSPITIIISMNLSVKLRLTRSCCPHTKHACAWNSLISFLLCQFILLVALFLNEIAVAIRLVSAIFYPLVSQTFTY